MLVARCYSVMDKIVVEVSCVHSGEPGASHLVIREERGPGLSGQRAALRALADVCDIAAWLIEAAEAGDPSGTVAQCEFGRLSPCD